MRFPHRTIVIVLTTGVVAACSGSDPAPAGPCDGTAPIALAAGEYRVVDPALSEGCLVLPAAGPAGAEYLVAAIATNGVQVTGGISGSFALMSGGATAATARSAPRARALPSDGSPQADGDFHATLRAD